MGVDWSKTVVTPTKELKGLERSNKKFWICLTSQVIKIHRWGVGVLNILQYCERKYAYYLGGWHFERTWSMFFYQGCYFMSLQVWAWASDHDQTFFNIFYPCQWNIRKIFFDTWDIMFGDMEEYFSACSCMNDIYDENKMDIFYEHWQHIFFVENWTKETWWKQFKLVYFKTFDTWNVQVTLQVTLHISLI